MFWRVFYFLFGFAGYASVAAIGASAETSGSGFSYGDWKGVAYSGSNGFSHCAISASYESGIELHFAIDKNNKWRLGIADPHWNKRVGSNFTARYQIDNHQPIAATAYMVAPEFALVELIDKPFFFNRFRSGQILHIRIGQSVYEFSLKGTSGALTKALDCVATHTNNSNSMPPSNSVDEAETQANQQPAPSESPAKSVGERALIFATSPQAVDDGTNFLIRLFSMGDFSDYHLFDPGELNGPKAPEFLKTGIAAWSASGAIGALHIVTLKDVSPNDVISQLISSDLQKCSGSFVSGNKAIEEGVTIVSQFSACKKAGKYTFFKDYVAFQKAPDVIYVITSMQNDTDQVDGSISERLVSNITAELERKSAANSVPIGP